jgi:hypothetical protein
MKNAGLSFFVLDGPNLIMENIFFHSFIMKFVYFFVFCVLCFVFFTKPEHSTGSFFQHIKIYLPPISNSHQHFTMKEARREKN